nr:hypothetical protein [Candidatus Sigynarchaeota archaeon]
MVDMKENDSIYDLFFQIKKENKVVEVCLKSGRSFNGTIGMIGRNNVVLKLRGDVSLFDAVIKLDEIAAIQYQARS